MIIEDKSAYSKCLFFIIPYLMSVYDVHIPRIIVGIKKRNSIFLGLWKTI